MVDSCGDGDGWSQVGMVDSCDKIIVLMLWRWAGTECC